MKVAVIIEAFWPSVEFGGPIRSTYQLCNYLAPLTDQLVVLTTNATIKGRPSFDNRWVTFEHYRVFYGRALGASLFAPSLLGVIRAIAREFDVLHVTGVYSWLLPWVALATSGTKARIVCAPRGALQPAARAQRRLKKQLFEMVVLNRALARVDAFHATSGVEASVLRHRFPRQPVLDIPNGVEIPETAAAERDCPAYFLCLGRLDPFKQIDRIIRAFASSSELSNRNIELWIAGSGEAKHEDFLHREAARTGAKVRFLGHVEGEKKAEVLRNAMALVVASKSESFSLVVAEALAHAVPCIVTSGVPWPQLNGRGCGLYLEGESEDAIRDGMERLASMDKEEHRQMGMRGRQWMASCYGWPVIAAQAKDQFESLVANSLTNMGDAGGSKG